MKKIFSSFILLCAFATTQTSQSLTWEDAAPYAIGIPVGLTAASACQMTSSYAHKTFLKGIGKIGAHAFEALNISGLVLAGIAAAYYIAQKTCKNECDQAPKHVLEKTIDIAALSSILGLMGYYVFKARLFPTPYSTTPSCPYLKVKSKVLKTLTASTVLDIPVPPFDPCADLPDFL